MDVVNPLYCFYFTFTKHAFLFVGSVANKDCLIYRVFIVFFSVLKGTNLYFIN